MRNILTVITLFIFLIGAAQQNQEELIRVKYNHPGLSSDLGVGLWAWPFPLDYDKDGDLDLLVNCPDKPFNGLWFFENISSNKPQIFKPPVHLAESQRNLQISNINGKIIAMTPGVVYPDFLQTFYEKPDTLFKEDFFAELKEKPRFNLWRQVDFENDGDLDIVISEFVDRLTWIENTGTRNMPEYASGKFIKINGEVLHLDLEMIVPTAIDWDEDKDIDLIIGEEDGRVIFLENTGKKDKDGPVFKPPVYIQQEAQFLKFGALVTPYSVDWDNDGDEDLICGNTAGYIGFIENLNGEETLKWAKPVYLKAGGETILIQAGENGSIQGPAERKWEYTTLSVADWNGDGLVDIVYNSIWGKIEWFENIGTKNNPQLAKSNPVEAEWNGTNPKPKWNWWNPEGNNLVTQWRTVPYAYDWNQDGLMDLIMLDHEGYPAFWERFKENGVLKLKPGKRIFTAEENSEFTNLFANDENGHLRLNTRESGSSGRRKFCIVDWDRDGKPDFLVNSININFLRNKGTTNGLTVLEDMGPLSDKILAGHSTSPTLVDWDKNGVPDLLIGAEDGHFYYLKNKAKH